MMGLGFEVIPNRETFKYFFNNQTNSFNYEKIEPYSN